MDPSLMKGELLSAEASLKAGDWDEAIMIAKSIIDQDVDQTDAHFILGAALMAKGDLAQAKESLSKALELSPDHTHAQFNLAKVFEQFGDLQAAVGAYKKLLSMPEDANLGPDFMMTVMQAINGLMKKISNTSSD